MIPFKIGVILFFIGLISGIFLAYYFLKERAKAWLSEWKTKYEDKIRKDVVKRSRSTLKGKVGEQMAPLLPVFEHEPSDARFIGSPIDYIIFDGLSEENPNKITFADVKTGESARLSSKERKIKDIVENGNVQWETIRIEDFED